MVHYDMRYAAREVDGAAAQDILDAGEFCVVSTVDVDGAPYGVPLSYVREGEALYLHSANEGGHKLEDFAHDARVCVTVVRNGGAFFQDTFFSTRYESAMAFGRISRVTDDKEMRQALVALCLKYVPEAKHGIGAAMEQELARTAVWRIDIEELTGKAAHREGQE